MPYTKEQLKERYENLPEDVKTVFDSVEMLDAISDISEQFNLHVDQQGILADEIGQVLLGITRPNDFLGHLQTRMKVPIETAGEIVKIANEKIFFPIRFSLEKMANGGLSPYQANPAPQVENFSPAGNISGENIQQPTRVVDKNNAIIVGEVKPLTDNRQPGQDIFDEKMSRLFHLPKEEQKLGSKEETTQPTKQDPYREQID